MYIIVEYITCVGVVCGFLTLMFMGWLLLLATREGAKHLTTSAARREPSKACAPPDDAARGEPDGIVVRVKPSRPPFGPGEQAGYGRGHDLPPVELLEGKRGSQANGDISQPPFHINRV
jgi:hypothetical protein